MRQNGCFSLQLAQFLSFKATVFSSVMFNSLYITISALMLDVIYLVGLKENRGTAASKAPLSDPVIVLFI
jgi:hypothetical protein